MTPNQDTARTELGEDRLGETSLRSVLGSTSMDQGDADRSAPRAPVISEALNPRGYSDISTVYAYYTAEEKARHGKHCEWWTDFGHRPENAPYRTGQERAFIEKVEAENPGKFGSYLISWSGCD